MPSSHLWRGERVRHAQRTLTAKLEAAYARITEPEKLVLKFSRESCDAPAVAPSRVVGPNAVGLGPAWLEAFYIGEHTADCGVPVCSSQGVGEVCSQLASVTAVGQLFCAKAARWPAASLLGSASHPWSPHAERELTFWGSWRRSCASYISNVAALFCTLTGRARLCVWSTTLFTSRTIEWVSVD